MNNPSIITFNFTVGYIYSDVTGDGHGAIHTLQHGDEILHVLGLFGRCQGNITFSYGW